MIKRSHRVKYSQILASVQRTIFSLESHLILIIFSFFPHNLLRPNLRTTEGRATDLSPQSLSNLFFQTSNRVHHFIRERERAFSMRAAREITSQRARHVARGR